MTFVLAISLIPLGVVGEEFIPAIDRGEIFIQVTYPIGTPLTTVETGIFAFEKKILGYPDIFANTAVAGAYAASFGGFVSQQNAGQVHVWLKDNRKHPTSYWVSEFRKLAKHVSPRRLGGCRALDRYGRRERAAGRLSRH